MNKYFYSKLSVLLLIIFQLSWGSIKLSNEAEISILTCKPGTELYSSFGHNAIRINDPIIRIDKVFNYGIFDFNTPNFYSKFVLGELKYRLAVSDYFRYKQEYIFDDRTMIEQSLNLPQNVKQSLFDLLNINYLPENRYYLYNFFYDNCSTRLRNIIEKATAGQLITPNDNALGNLSFRNSLKPFLQDRQWLNFGMDLILGLPSDKIMSNREFTFLPDELYKSYENTTWYNTDEDLIDKTEIIYQSSRQSDYVEYIFSPTVILWVVFLLIGVVLWFNHTTENAIMELILLALSSLFGLIFLFLWFFTNHKSMAINLNILWAIPTHLPVVILYKWLSDKFKVYYFLVTGLLMILVLIGWKFIPQEFSVATIPIILMLIVSSFSIYYKIRNRLFVNKELS